MNGFTGLSGQKRWIGTLDQLAFLLGRPAVSYIRLRVSLEALREAGLFRLIDREMFWEYRLFRCPKRRT